MDPLTVQPDALRVSEEKYDALEIIEIDDHLVLIQVSEAGESETLVIGPEQQKALAALIARRNVA